MIFSAVATLAPVQDAEPVDMFDVAPVSLWLEDYSEVRDLLDRWRTEGVTDLRAHLEADASRVAACALRIRVRRVNRRTLELFRAIDQDHLAANLHRVMRDDMFPSFIVELVNLWQGCLRITTQSVNYTLQGKRLDISLSAQILPGSETTWARVLVAIEDTTERVAMQQALADAEAYARAIFEHSPVSLRVEDHSAVRSMIDAVRASGVDDLRAWLHAHPGFVRDCAKAVRVLDVNRRTLQTYGAHDLRALVDNLDTVLGDELDSYFAAQLIDLWAGRLFQQREVVNHSLHGERIDLYLQFAVLPGHEHDWALVLVSLIDITARKRAEAEAAYLATHDSLTGLHNRSHFAGELRRMEHEGPWPIALMVFDLDGLKPVNDQHGHAAGDRLIRRASAVLDAALAASCGSAAGLPPAVVAGAQAARLGGDEFALLLPATDAGLAECVRRGIEALVDIDNARADGAPLSFSIGCALLERGESADAALHLADERMYADKRDHYRRRGLDRRGDHRFEGVTPT